jgi:serine/threonine protein kinase
MPYCETSLFDVVKGSGRLDEKTARYYFRQILQGILHMQRSGVCHRDLSLENILLHHDTAVIIDFGIALRVPLERRRLRQLIQPTEPCGKPYYMAPEIRNTQVFDGFAVDLWAAAVVLFILLVGNPPWDHPGNNMRYELIAKQDQLACLLNSWDRSVSQDAADLLQSMLREDPHERLSLKQILEHPWMLADDVAV